MARGGINKAQVAKARESVLDKGQNPSIDSVRVELGNTGSKSTIHRYLRELEEEASTRLDDEALLSQPIKELIVRLASRLREEARSVVDQSRDNYEQKLHSLTIQVNELEKQAASLTEKLEGKEQELQSAVIELSAREAAGDILKTKDIEARQTEAKLNALLEEKQKHIDSLEEKHRHSRDALEHYRQSVKEQRDQDQRNHEHQLQQLQAEIRTLNQTLSLKQTDITQLNKDNSRLVSELGAAQKSLISAESLKYKQENRVKSLESQFNKSNTKVDSYRKEAEIWASDKEKLGELTSWRETVVVKIAKLESELSVKDDMIERLMISKR